ncbi:MAG: hypothetical protein ABUL72_06330 [Armatimonadota bacterium]
MNPEVVKMLVVGMAAISMPVAIIIITLTSHQRKMAELIYGRQPSASDQAMQQVLMDNQRILAELENLREQVRHQSLPSSQELRA